MHNSKGSLTQSARSFGISHIEDERVREAVLQSLNQIRSDDPELASLVLKDIPLQDSGITSLAFFLRKNTHLRILNLQNVGVGESGLESFAAALTGNKTLENVTLKLKEPIQEEALQNFVLALQRNRRLVLDLSPIDRTLLSEKSYKGFKNLLRKNSRKQTKQSSPGFLRKRSVTGSLTGKSSAPHPHIPKINHLSLSLDEEALPNSVRQRSSSVSSISSCEDRKRSSTPILFSLGRREPLLEAFREMTNHLSKLTTEKREWWNTKPDIWENIQQTVVNLCDHPNILQTPSALKLLKEFALSVLPEKSPPKSFPDRTPQTRPLSSKKMEKNEKKGKTLKEKKRKSELKKRSSQTLSPNSASSDSVFPSCPSSPIRLEFERNDAAACLSRNRGLSFQGHDKIARRSSSPTIVKYDVDFSKAKITKVLAPRGGSGAAIFSVDVNGLHCVMKEYFFNREVADTKLKKFSEEIKMIESLHHPNIVRYLGRNTKRTCAQMFLTRYESTLRREVQQRWEDFKSENDDPFSPLDIAQIVLKISRGLDYLHYHKIIHRDIKSDNMFVNFDERGNISEVVIADFDTSKILLTDQTKTLTGTPYYMAPEVLRVGYSDIGYTKKADIWSFGMVIYELLTLSLPYGGDMKSSQEIALGKIPPIPSPSSKLPSKEEWKFYEPLIDLFRKCCVKNPEERLSASSLLESAEEIAHLL